MHKSLSAIFIILTLSLQSLVSQASLFGSSAPNQPLSVDKAFQFEAEQTGSSQIDLVWQVAPDYYLYQSRIEITPPEGVLILERTDSETDSKDDPLFGNVEVFHDLAEVRLKVFRESEAVDSQGKIGLSYQGCWEGGICYPPVTTEIAFADLAVVDQPDNLTPLAQSSATSTGSDSEPILSEQDQFLQTIFSASLATLLAAFFVAGLALSFTPCVFPMIPILSGIIAGQGNRVDTRKGLILSTVYVLAMAVTYTLAGVIAGLFGANLQAGLQLPWVISLFSLIFVALALSMFGFFNLQFPSILQSWLSKGSERQKGGSYAGVAVMGFLSALIVGPCMAAPLAGALIYIGQTGDPLLGGLALFSMSMGMGLPLILLGTSAAKFLPRAGRWMETVKAGFGVVLLLMAVWMLDRILPVEITMILVALILIVTSVYMGAMDGLKKDATGWHKLAKGFGLVVFIYSVILMIGLLAGGKGLAYPLKGIVQSQQQSADELVFARVTTEAALDDVLASAKQNGLPVMLDYYADWCVSCKELEFVTFADSEVKRQLGLIQLVKVDVTANDEEARKLTDRHQVLGPPTLVFYDEKGQYLRALNLVGVPSPEQLLTNLERI